MRYVPVTAGEQVLQALVSDEDFECINQRTWYLSGTGYVTAYVKGSGRASRKFIYMHRDVLRYTGRRDIDHVNRNKLDNRRENLRIVSRGINLHNTGKRTDNTSGHKGVSWLKANRRWHAYYNSEGRRRNIGYYKKLEDAVQAREKYESTQLVKED